VTAKKCLVLSTKHLVAAAKFLVAGTKKIFVVPNFVAVTKPFFFLEGNTTCFPWHKRHTSKAVK